MRAYIFYFLRQQEESEEEDYPEGLLGDILGHDFQRKTAKVELSEFEKAGVVLLYFSSS